MTKKQFLYENIYNDLKQKIECGDLKPGDKLEVEEDMVAHYGVSAITVKKALNLLAEENGKELAEKLGTQGAEGRIIILTPHVGELSRLLAKTIPECKKELPECGRELAERFHGVAVAKDARTIVCKEQGEFYLNTTGNSGMATAGSGDVLTGVILGLLAQGMNAIDAAVNGVYLHGRAGELAAKLHTEYGVMAGDIADCLMKDYDEKESVKK